MNLATIYFNTRDSTLSSEFSEYSLVFPNHLFGSFSDDNVSVAIRSIFCPKLTRVFRLLQPIVLENETVTAIKKTILPYTKIFYNDSYELLQKIKKMFNVHSSIIKIKQKRDGTVSLQLDIGYSMKLSKELCNILGIECKGDYYNTGDEEVIVNDSIGDILVLLETNMCGLTRFGYNNNLFVHEMFVQKANMPNVDYTVFMPTQLKYNRINVSSVFRIGFSLRDITANLFSNPNKPVVVEFMFKTEHLF